MKMIIAGCMVLMATSLTAQSLADAARAQRHKPSSSTHVYTNDDFGPSPAAPSNDAGPPPESSALPVPARTDSVQAKALINDIKASLGKIRTLEQHIKDLQAKLDERDAMPPAGTATVSKLEISQRVIMQPSSGLGGSGVQTGPCGLGASYNPYQEWCEQPDKWRAEIAKTQTELDVEHKKLEALQESARKMGMGSKIYDPES